MSCIEENCSERADYNIKGEIAKYCVKHSTVLASTGTDSMISNPKSYCIHEKQIHQCVECRSVGQASIKASLVYYMFKKEGYSICIHEKQKAQCVQCRGSDICIHGKLKPTCMQCFYCTLVQ